VNIIAAVDENWGIGHSGKLLASIPEDMKFFSRMTTGKIVVMGHATLKSLPNSAPLKNRTNIVLSKNRNLTIKGAVVYNEKNQLFDYIKNCSDKEVFVIGGEKIYKLLLPYCTRAYITKIFKSFPADRFFPDLDSLPDWKITSRSGRKKHNDIEYEFLTYDKVLDASIYL
jgi:dihydrofolate reductase